MKLVGIQETKKSRRPWWEGREGEERGRVWWCVHVVMWDGDREREREGDENSDGISASTLFWHCLERLTECVYNLKRACQRGGGTDWGQRCMLCMQGIS